ncbi:hypothetical protein DQ238_08100 [Geodermatophilus sp. TF02-6]|uniref:DUF4276 family protein n=1 Tax=Geodermatophilus sp. TF02-6 TaxID=2250575 RepID=UPI000DEB6C64|nr:DUF4276 family protein [Geodermatophilus sp. TF02-6]RBY80540.1 hypothetical protein DQ238_08100 [Geodermatophilus sp. TF02-6]
MGLVVEGETDRVAMTAVLRTRGLEVDPRRVKVTRGKQEFDRRVAKYNQAARHAPWLAVRDLDRDGNDCAMTLRRRLLAPEEQAPALALRIAVHTLDAWLLADGQTFASFFGVTRDRLPQSPEELADPKGALVDLCRRSSSALIRRGIVPPGRSPRRVGPEYTSLISEYAETAWQPDAAAVAAPSLARLLRQVDVLVSQGMWP